MSDNDELVVKNAKDIQRLEDTFVIQAQVNKNNTKSLIWLSIMSGVALGIGLGVDRALSRLKERVDAIEGKFVDEE